MSFKTGFAAALVGAVVSLYAIDAMAQDHRGHGMSQRHHAGYRAQPMSRPAYAYPARRPYVAPMAARLTHRQVAYHRGHHGRHYGYAAARGASSYAFVGGAGYISQPTYAPESNVRYAQPQYYSRTYAVPTTAYQPVTRTYAIPVTSYQQVQRTEYVPTTVYRPVTRTCSCSEY